MTDISAAIASMPPASRSRVGNGSRVIENVDGRTRRGRRFRDVLDNLALEYGAANESDLALCRAAATLVLSIEDMAARTVRGESNDPALAARVSTRLQRALGALAASKRQRMRGAR